MEEIQRERERKRGREVKKDRDKEEAKRCGKVIKEFDKTNRGENI